MNDFQRLEKAFQKLENRIPHFGARLNFWCCGGCGHLAMQNNGRQEYVFAHEQGMEKAFEPVIETTYFDAEGNEVAEYEDYATEQEETVGYTGKLTGGLHLYHHLENQSTKKAVVEAIKDAGFDVEWNGDASKAILVKSKPH